MTTPLAITARSHELSRIGDTLLCASTVFGVAGLTVSKIHCVTLLVLEHAVHLGIYYFNRVNQLNLLSEQFLV